jgi:hypothetical protein
LENIAEQKIAVYFDLKSTNEIALMHGLFLAKVFNRELCLLHPVKRKEDRQGVRDVLSAECRKLMKQYPDVNFSSLIPTGSFESIQESLGGDWDVVLLIAEKSRFSTLVGGLKEANIPFLFVDNNKQVAQQYENLILPVDFRREIKDCGIWASYFARFVKSNILLVTAKESGDEKKRIDLNVLSIRKLFRSVGQEFLLIQSNRSSWFIQKEATKYKMGGGKCYAFLGSRYDSFADLLIGTPEKRILKHTSGCPVLFVNPRKDMYVMCD